MGNKKKGKILAVLLSGTLLGAQLPGMTVAEGAAGYTGGICEHHPVHTAECGYQEAAAERPCRHEHTKECYEYVTNCVHEHTEECYTLIAVDVSSEEADTEGTAENAEEAAEPQTELVRGPEPTACTHVCSEESGCVTKTLNCIHEDKVNADGSITPAVHDASCGYAPAVEGKECTFVCGICSVPEETDSETETSTEETPDFDAEAETDEAIPDEAVTAVQTMIDALPDVEVVKELMQNQEANSEILGSYYQQIGEALEAYEVLTGEQQAEVGEERVNKVLALKECFMPEAVTLAGNVAAVEINGQKTNYLSLDAAITAANGKTATITLLQDCSLENDVTISGNITFIGGTHTVKWGGKWSGSVYVSGSLTIKSGIFNHIPIWANQNGKVIIQGGTIEDVISNGGLVEVNGGSIDSLQLTKAEGATAIVKGGTVKNIVNVGNGTVTYNPTVTVSVQFVTAGKITVTPLDNTTTFGSASYSLDGQNWQSSNELNCKANQRYTVYARYSKAQNKIGSKSVTSNTASYTVTIPSATLTAGDTTSKAEISVDTSEDFDLGYGGQVQVKVKSGEAVSAGGVLTMTRQGASGTVTSDMLVNGTEFTDISKPVATFTMENYNSAKAVVSFAQPTGTQTVIPAGTYSGTVTFEVTYSEQEGGTE